MNVDVVVMVVALDVHSVGCGLGRVSPLGSGCEKDTQTHTHTPGSPAIVWSLTQCGALWPQ